MPHQDAVQWDVRNPSARIILLDFVEIAAEDIPEYDH
jgi:hypothetical protein